MFDRNKLLKQAKEQFAADADLLDAVECILTEYQSPYWTVLYKKHYGFHTLQGQAELSDSTTRRLIKHFNEDEVNNSKYGIFINKYTTMRDQNAGVKPTLVFFIHFNPHKDGEWNELGSIQGNTKNTKNQSYKLSAVNYLKKTNQGIKLKQGLIEFLAKTRLINTSTPLSLKKTSTPSKKTPKANRSKSNSRQQGQKSTIKNQSHSNSSGRKKRRRALLLSPPNYNDRFNAIFTNLCGNLYENISQVGTSPKEQSILRKILLSISAKAIDILRQMTLCPRERCTGHTVKFETFLDLSLEIPHKRMHTQNVLLFIIFIFCCCRVGYNFIIGILYIFKYKQIIFLLSRQNFQLFGTFGWDTIL